MLGVPSDILPKIRLDAANLSDFDSALNTEWLVTNGLGGYASSTVLGVNTRKYHGVLVAALSPPVDRRVLLAKLDEQIVLENHTYNFGANESRGGIRTQDSWAPTNFSLAPFPTFVYNIDQRLQLKKTIFMPHERNTSIITYGMVNSTEITANLSIVPLVNSRNFHWVTPKGQIEWKIVQQSPQRVVIQPIEESSTLILFSTEAHFTKGQGEWIETFYRTEAQRGESSLDYNYAPGLFKLELAPSETKRFSVVAVAGKTVDEAARLLSTLCNGSKDVDALFQSEMQRRINLLEGFCKHHEDIMLEDWLKWLVLAADAFVVNRTSTSSKSVIAGYHWFNDWGRDSLISLPGLALTTGRFEEAKNIFLTFSHYCREGLVPNSFPDNVGDSPAYNTVDASLWYFNAVLQFLKYTGDFQFVKEKLWSTLKSIVDQHTRGTMFNIHVDADGLLTHGPQLTWMDAAPDGKPVTPRAGKAVEIQALWYNALRIMQFLSSRFGEKDAADAYLMMAEKAQRSFLGEFWNAQLNALIDVVADDFKDASIRPNQILTVSLDFPMLEKVRAQQVVDIVWKQLSTPYGLRSLSPNDSRYFGRYRGDRWQRDKAYHNGTIWPWLLGPFVTAFLKLKNYDAQMRSFAFDSFLKPLFTEELYRAGLGSLSEALDGDPPHEPGGCIAQAWSVAEPLRAYVEDVLLKRPPFEKQVLTVD